MTCAFCDDKNLTLRTIYKDELVMAFPSTASIVAGHTLVCPLRHVEKVDDLSEGELKSIKDFIVQLKEAMKKCLGAEGFNIAWNEGEKAGQSVSHLHIHVLPRKGGDTGIYEYEPRKFLYRTDFESRKLPGIEELQEISHLIKNSL
ncbi:MAG: HIT domain-containing protein [Candidatus Staskawiczbacteria bacterium]|nr:HIT domain-containing protein [Candidatus Staskawiczbacteria bacterium]